MFRFRLAPLVLCAVSVFSHDAAGADEGRPSTVSATEAARTIGPFVDEDTIAVAHVNLAPADVERFFTLAAPFLPAGHPLLRMKDADQRWLETLRQIGGRDFYVIVSLADVPEQGPFMVVPLAKDADVEPLKKLCSGTAVVERLGDVLFVGDRGARERLATALPVRRPELARALEAVGECQMRAVFMPSAAARRVVEELMPTLPAEIGGGQTTLLTRGMLWAALGADASPQPRLRLVVQSQTADAARALKAHLAGLLRDRLPQLDKLAAAIVPEVRDDRLVLTLDGQKIESLATVVRPVLELLTNLARRRQSTGQLKQIGLAMHNYADANKHFPPAAIADAQGRPLLSWRVAVLPYLEQNALYKEFHLDEPWDSEHNRRLVERMPEVFRSFSSTAAADRTCYVVPVGPGTAFKGKTGTGIGEITDGASNTIMAIELGDEQAVVWTKPDDYRFDAKRPSAGLTTPYADGRLFVFCDGSAHFTAQALNDETLRRLFVRNDGKPIEE